MNEREKDLSDIKSFIAETDKELTLLLQSLQWDRQHLLQGKSLVQCKYDPEHRIPEEIKEKHEQQCFYKKEGYNEEDELLPDPFDSSANTLVKLSSAETHKMLCEATIADRYLDREGCKGVLPMSLARLQATFTAGERRVIHDAVVAAAPACHDLSDLTLISKEESNKTAQKTRVEILAELRNMRRRRIKYRVASKTRNYSDVLRDVIRAQMELYTGVETPPMKPNVAQGEDPHDQAQKNGKKTKEGKIPGQRKNKRKNKKKRKHNYDNEPKHQERNRNGNSFGVRVERPNISKIYGQQMEGRHNRELKDNGKSFREREPITNEKHRHDRERRHARLTNSGHSSRGDERKYNTSEYRHEKDIRDRGKSSKTVEKTRHSIEKEYKKDKERRYENEITSSGNASREGERKRHSTKEEHRYEKERRHDGESRDTENLSKEGDKSKHSTSEKYQHKNERKQEKESRDERKEEKCDNNKNYESRSHHDVEDKEEKRKRRDSHDDQPHDEKRMREN